MNECQDICTRPLRHRLNFRHLGRVAVGARVSSFLSALSVASGALSAPVTPTFSLVSFRALSCSHRNPFSETGPFIPFLVFSPFVYTIFPLTCTCYTFWNWTWSSLWRFVLFPLWTFRVCLPCRCFSLQYFMRKIISSLSFCIQVDNVLQWCVVCIVRVCFWFVFLSLYSINIRLFTCVVF